MVVAGIHFGNTNSVIAICKNGKVSTVSNETGDRITPTIVAYTGSEKIVGQPAKQYLIRNPLSCITHIKSSIGQSFTDEHVQQMKTGCSCKMSNVNGTISFKVKVDQDFVTVSSVKAASYIFTKLLEIAELVGGSDLEDVVLTVPHDFTEEQRIFLCEAAEKIGCNVLRVISEPAAALLGYGIGQDDPNLECNVVVYRIGGSSMDATIMNVNSGMYRLIDQKTSRNFGSKNFDNVLVQHFAQEFKRKYKADLSENKRAIGKLQTAVEECKYGLSRMQATTCSVESLYDGLDFQTQLVRAKFESMCGKEYSQCTLLLDSLFESSSLTEKDIRYVILVGGGTHMPRIVSLLKSRFESSEILNHICPDELLAQGAAVQASHLQGREDILLNSAVATTECVSTNIGIKVIENNLECLDVIISQNTPVPTRRFRTFQCDKAQTSLCLSILESSDSSLENSKLLAKIVIKNLSPDVIKDFKLNFEINKNKCLQIMLTEKNSQKTEQVTIDITSS